MSDNDSDSDSSTNSDFNFGPMVLSDTEQETKSNENTVTSDIHSSDSTNCNLKILKPLWFLNEFHHSKPTQTPQPLQRSDSELAQKRYQCEYFYAMGNYNKSLQIIQEIFIEYDVRAQSQFGNELTDILCRCLCQCNKYELALQQISNLLVRDISFGSIQLITNIYSHCKHFDIAYDYAIKLSMEEPLNPIVWFQLSLNAKDRKDYNFGFVCLRILRFIVRYWAMKKRYETSKEYTDFLMEYAENEMDSIKLLLTNESFMNYPLPNIHEPFQSFDLKQSKFLFSVCKRFDFNNLNAINVKTEITCNASKQYQCDTCNETFAFAIDLMLHQKVHKTTAEQKAND